MKIVSCPDRDTLFGYLIGTIPEADATAVAEHLSGCSRCEETVQALESRSDTILSALRQPVEGGVGDEPACRRLLERLRGLESGHSDPSAPPAAQPHRNASGESVQPPPRPRRTKVLGDYELLKKLGQGGMGAVYLARHTRLKRTVALKVLPKDRLANAEAVARFEREMEAVGRLDHPQIVRALDAREVGGIRFLVMEYVDGLDLSEVLRRCGPFSLADACEVIRQASLGLQCSHENGLVHRDVKPSNLMLTSTGEVKLLDLGLAQIQEAESLRGEITGANQVMGTPDYLAPEQAQGQAVDIRTDLYSLGCTLYHLLAGRAPFSGPDYDTPMEKVSGHIRDGVPPIQLRRQDVPKPVAVLLDRMLAKDANQRPGTPSQVADVLAPFCQGSKLIGLLREARSRRSADEKDSSHMETGELRASGQFDTDPLGEQVAQAGKTPREPAEFDPYHRWLGIPPEEQPPDHYRLLGIARFESDPEVIRDAAARQMAHVRTYHLGPHAEMSQRILNELGIAKACLLNLQKKVAYDAALSEERQVVDRPMPESEPQGQTAIPAAQPIPVKKESPGQLPQPLLQATATRSRSWKYKPPTRFWIAVGGLAVFALFAVVLYISTNTGRVKIALSDPSADIEIRVDGDEVEIAGLGEPLRLWPGPHELTVTGKDYEAIGRSFRVRRGDNPALTVELVPKSAARTTPQTPNRPGEPALGASVSMPAAGPRKPLFADGSPRVLGFCTGSQPERLEEYASYTNVVQTRIEHLDTVAPIARRYGLRVVVNPELSESEMDLRLEDSFVQAIRGHKEVVAAVCWNLRPRSYGQAEIARFGQHLKTVLPDVQFWCGFAVLNETADTIDQIPPEVDCISVFVPSANDLDTAAKNAETIASWLAKANRHRRPTVLMWVARERSNLAELQRSVERFNLDGLILASYSKDHRGKGPIDGIGDDEVALAEVKMIAADWGIASRPVESIPSQPTFFPPAATDRGSKSEKGPTPSSATSAPTDAQRRESQAETKPEKFAAPTDAVEFQGHYYKVFESPLLTWHLGLEHCRTLGGHLVQIESEGEQAFVARLLARRAADKSYWIDGTDEENEGVWRFSDGRPISFSKWASREPTHAKGSVPEHSLELGPGKNYLWNDLCSGYRQPFVCEWDHAGGPSELKPQVPAAVPSMPKDAAEFAGHHYQIYWARSPWHVAKQRCEAAGGHLVRIESREEQRFIDELIKRSPGPRFLIGLGYWADGSDAKSEGAWQYSDGRPLVYTNWAATQPDNYDGVQHYLTIRGSDDENPGTWDDIWPSQRQSYICEWDHGLSLQAVPESPKVTTPPTEPIAAGSSRTTPPASATTATPTPTMHPSPAPPAPATNKVARSPAPYRHDPVYVQCIRERFRRWDADGDGKLSMVEIKEQFSKIKSPDALHSLPELLWRLDLDRDVSLTEKELLGLCQAATASRDLDGDGKITLSELMVRPMSANPTKESVATSFQRADINGDGYLTPQEMEKGIAALLAD